MDVIIQVAAHALARGDPLHALNCVALRDDAPALALRGIAMAQLGDLTRARTLLRSAVRAFGPDAEAERAKCVVAQSEIDLATRELASSTKLLDGARETLQRRGDRVNASHACSIAIRRLILLGRLDEAERMLGTMDVYLLPPTLGAARELAIAAIAVRRRRSEAARGALLRAEQLARESGISSLMSEVERAATVLTRPMARLVARGRDQILRLDEVEALLASDALVADACANALQFGGIRISLAGRPMLFALLRELAAAWPADVPRDLLIARAFRSRFADESHRARLRVEVARLRRAIRALADVGATRRGYVLAPRHTREVALLTYPVEARHMEILICLADGEAWSSSALALSLRTGQRTVQRALGALSEDGQVQSFGQGRSRRWRMGLLPGYATSLLLPFHLF